MKKIILIFALVPTILLSQTFVSTTPENKNVVLEGYTGMYCSWCPAGHVIAAGMHAANPNDIFIIKVHTGGFATPNVPSDPNFKSDFGSQLANNANVTGYPTGSINRRIFPVNPGGTAMSRSDWDASAQTVLAESSPVNIGTQASFDMATGILTVDVETYYTSTVTNTNVLHIAVVQNNMPGPQSGAVSNGDPAMIISGPWSPTYNHQDVLRHFITGANGLQYTSTTAGTFVPQQFTWNIPTPFTNSQAGSGYIPDIDPTNLSIIAFIDEGGSNIITATEAVVVPIFSNAFDANVTGSTSPDVLCATDNDISVTFRNFGNQPLTSLDLTYDINGGTPATYNWTGNLNSGDQATVTVQNVSFSPIADSFGNPGNVVNWVASNPNGQVDQNSTNNSSTSNFTHKEISGDVIQGITAGNISIDITTDGYGSETTWEVVAEDGTIYGSGGPYPSSTTIPTISVPVTGNQCFEFILYDSYGDGMCCANGVGSVLVQDAMGAIIFQGDPVNLQNFSEISSPFSTGVGTGPAWECSPFGCVEGTPGLGIYMSESQCESDPSTGCYVGPTWNCDPFQGCIDVGTAGLGTYNTELECINDISNSCSFVSTTIWSEDFSNGLSFWTNSSVPWEYRGPNTSPNNSIGSIGAYATNLTPIASPTASNGFVIFDSDYYDNGGIAGSFGTGLYPANGTYMGTITSPSIDCSIYPNLTLKFNSYYREYTGIARVAFSTDGGLTFTDTIEVHPNINVNEATNTDEQVNINLPSNIGYQSDVRIQFIYDATVQYNGFYGYYFWMIDDIQLIETPPNLIECENEVFGGWWLGYQTTGDIGCNYTFNPMAQVSGNPYRLEGIVRNLGSNSQDNTTLHGDIADDAGNVLFSDVSNGVTLGVSSSATLALNSFYTPTGTGLHNISIWATSDYFPTTDTAIFSTIVTDSIYAIDYDWNSDGANLGTNAWRIGRTCGGQVGANAFDIYNTDTITSISFHVGSQSVVGAQMTTEIYEGLGTNSIFLAESDPYSLTAADIGNWVTIPLQSPIQLFAGTSYMAAVRGQAHPTDTFLITVAENPYAASYIQDNGCNLNSANPAGTWYTATDKMAIRMNLGEINNCNIVNSISTINPSDSISCDGTIIVNSSSSNPISSYSLTDQNGVVISTNNFGLNLCNGLYFLTVTDNAGCQALDTIVLGIVYGCMDSIALNFNPFAVVDDGTCTYPTIYGCTDSTAINFDPLANTNDGSCIYCDLTNTMIISQNTSGNCDGFIIANSTSSYGPISYLWSTGSTQNNILALCDGIYTIIITDQLGCTIEDTIVIGTIYGCTDSLALNFDPFANNDDGSCIYCDLTNTFVVNNNTPGNCDGFILANSSTSNGPISYLWNTGSTQNNIINLCAGTYTVTINDAANCTIEDTVYLGLVLGCTDPTALNYDPLATVDDGSCTYSSNCTSPKPTGLFAFDVIDTRAKVSWDNMNDPNCMVWKYFVRYREVGTSGWTTKSAGVGNGLCNFGLNTVTKQLLNLTPSTTYEFRMKAFYCGGTSSNYSTPVQFTTADPCPDMTNLTATTFNSNQSKVRFNWDTTGTYTFARILLRVDVPGSNWQTAGGFGVYYPTFFVNKFGLNAGENYRAQGRTFCDSNITAYRSPTWTAPIFWTQPGSIKLDGGTAINNLDVYPNPSRDVFNISFNSDKRQDLTIRILNVVGGEVYREDKQQFVGEYIKQISLDNYGKGIYFLEIQTSQGIVNKKLILQ